MIAKTTLIAEKSRKTSTNFATKVGKKYNTKRLTNNGYFAIITA
jgi:hypothetical protein